MRPFLRNQYRFATAAMILVCLVVHIASGAQLDSDAVVANFMDPSGISRGVCVVIGCNNVDLIRASAGTGDMYVHALDTDHEVVESVKRQLDSDGVYGSAAIAETFDGKRLPHADNIVDMIILDQTGGNRMANIDVDEMMRVLRPRGKAFLGGENVRRADLLSRLRAAGIHDGEIVENPLGLWAVVTKPVPDGVDNWSHWEHGPDNNPMSEDSVIRAPYMSQWYGTPMYSAMPAITTAAGGRTFLAMGHIAHHQREEEWINTLLARNGYNGTTLWQKKLPDGYLVHRSAFVATDDVFYMIDTGGKGCLKLDPESGEELETIRIDDVEGDWKWMAIKDGILYVLAGSLKDPPQVTMGRNPHAGWSWDNLSSGYYHDRIPWGIGSTIVAYDLSKRRLMWKHTAPAAIDSRAMAIGGGQLFYYCPDALIGCLDAKSGDVTWQNTDTHVRELIEDRGNGFRGTPGFRTTCFCLFTPDALVFEADARLNSVAVSTADGSFLWTLPKNSNDPNMLFADGKLIIGVGENAHNITVEPASGKITDNLGFRKLNCARMTGTKDSFFCRSRYEGLARYDRATGEVYYNSAVRPACNDGAIGANGLLYMGPWLCDCNLSLIGTMALCSAGDFSISTDLRESDRLEIFKTDVNSSNPVAVSSDDWPTYRSRNDRSSRSEVSIPIETARLWKFEALKEYTPTPPSSADGLIFIGGDDCAVRALDAHDGSVRWSYLTAGTIMRAPTVWNGRVFVGSGDGFIYCLDASDGTLLWRFRAAPVERRIMIYGSLCSTWPVNSGILVQDGVVYAAAGIIDFDGTCIYALDAESGKLIWHNSESGHLDARSRKGVSAQGMMTIADGRLWMAGGNVVSPASFDLATGKCLNEPPTNQKKNRGEEIGVLNGKHILLGGRLQFSSRKNVVSPAYFEAHRLEAGKGISRRKVFNKGRIAPAWNDDFVVFADGLNYLPECFRMDAIDSYLGQDVKSAALPERVWFAEGPSKSEKRVFRTAHTGYRIPGDRDMVSLAIAKNAVMAVYETGGHETQQHRWSVAAHDLKDGSVIWEHNLNPWGILVARANMVNTLSEPALPSGLLVDRDGRVVVVLENGSVVCFGKE
ncbi:PQQ-binding-like beta-propeller repeat protein [Candidatus Latescibacterota bacterium]